MPSADNKFGFLFCNSCFLGNIAYCKTKKFIPPNLLVQTTSESPFVFYLHIRTLE